MLRTLIACFGHESLSYVHACRERGMYVRVLDCFEQHHKQLTIWYGEDVLHAGGRRSEVTSRVQQHAFDVAIVHEEDDFVRTALITQALRDAGIDTIFVVTNDEAKRRMYRRFGAHKVIVADTPHLAWPELSRYLPTFATA